MSKPAAKIIATFAVASILTPIACAFIIPSSIPVLPGLIVLGSEYWASVSVSLVSLAVYPLITAAFRVIFNGVSCASHFLARRVHLLGQRLGVFKRKSLDDRASYHNLMSEIRFDSSERRFFINRNGKETAISRVQIRDYIEKSLRLERCEILLEGKRDEIIRCFRDKDKTSNKNAKSIDRSFLSRSDLPYPSGDSRANGIDTTTELPVPDTDEDTRAFIELSERVRIHGSFNQMINNEPQQPFWETIVNYYLMEQVRKKADKEYAKLIRMGSPAQSSSSN